MAPTERETYAAAVRRIEGAIFGRRGEGHVDPSNDRMRQLVELLGDPQKAFRGIHLTGTNGKTSTARMVDELLRGFGIRTGRYTSPHLASVTERIVLDGLPVPDRTFAEAYDELVPYVELVDSRNTTPLSFFEIVTALAFAIFADAPVDVAVVEVGMGGTWDNTNVLDGEVAVITPIDLDHTEYLGPTVESIASEKAGIIKPGAAAILAAQQPAAAEQLLRQAATVGATVAREGLEFGVLARDVAVGGQVMALQGLAGVYDEIFLPLFGAHQAQNASLALAAVEAFFGAGADSGPLDVDVVRAAFAAVRSPGRLEAVRSAPTILVDAAHNPHGMAASVAAIGESFDFRRLVAVVAVLADKDLAGMLEVLEPLVDELVVTQNGSSRAVPADTVAAAAVEVFGPDRVTVEPRLDDAIETAVRLAEDTGDDVLAGSGVLVTGSVVTAGEARALLGGDAVSTDAPRADDADAVEDRRRRADRSTKGALAGVLGLEAVTTLLVPRALAFSEGGLGVTKTVLLAVLAVTMIAAAGLLRRPWGIGFGSALQVLFILSGLWLIPLLIIAALFAAVWLRLLFLRTEVAGTARRVSLLWS